MKTCVKMDESCCFFFSVLKKLSEFHTREKCFSRNVHGWKKNLGKIRFQVLSQERKLFRSDFFKIVTCPSGLLYLAVKTKQNTKDPPGLLPHLSSSFFFRVQVSWRALSSEHPTLKPVQLHRILTQYQLTAEIGPVPAWQPSSEDEAYIYRTGTCVNL